MCLPCGLTPWQTESGVDRDATKDRGFKSKQSAGDYDTIAE